MSKCNVSKYINKHIKIVDVDALRITVKFAENNLSKSCLECCDYKSDKYYEWTVGSTAYAVFFELPTIFGVHVQDMFNLVSIYCPEYWEKRGLTPKNFVFIFEENMKKEIVYREA